MAEFNSKKIILKKWKFRVIHGGLPRFLRICVVVLSEKWKFVHCEVLFNNKILHQTTYKIGVSMKNESTQFILNYWRQMEFFNPFHVSDSELMDKSTTILPWDDAERPPSPEGKQYVYHLFFGTYSISSLIGRYYKNAQLPYTEVEDDATLCHLAGVRVTENGFYEDNSFEFVGFPWAVSCLFPQKQEILMELGGIGSTGYHQERGYMEQQCREFLSKPFTSETLLNLHNSLLELLHMKDITSDWNLYWCSELLPVEEEARKKAVNSSYRILPSFYAKDLENIQTHCSTTDDKIIDFITALDPSCPTPPRCEVANDVTQMQEALSVDRYPKGLWPSQHTPSLMQQISINLATTTNDPVFAINGPPGTGKTTLVKEIIASNVVERAIFLSELSKPDDGFEKKTFGSHSRPYFVPKDEISDYGIFIASNNNAAVENISQELPKLIEKDRSGLFSSIQIGIGDDGYFSFLATEFRKEESWGIISAKMGKSENLFKLRYQCLEEFLSKKWNTPDWDTAKKEFQETLAQVMSARAYLKKAQEDYALSLEHKDIFYPSTPSAANILAITEELKKLGPLFYDSYLNWFATKHTLEQYDPENPKYTAVPKEMWEEHEKKTLKQYHHLEEKFNQLKAQLPPQVGNEPQQEAWVTELFQRLREYKEVMGASFPEGDFWENIAENDTSQSLCPWRYEEYDRLRETLFYRALALQKSFVLNSTAVSTNLTIYRDLRGIKPDMGDKFPEVHSSCLNTLTTFIPVVSTTFASVSRFLVDIPPSSLGTLIIDEAGQATPASSLGALFRTKKAIIVGDPFQVEPVVTVPKDISDKLATDNQIPLAYFSPTLSAQHLGDSISTYGAKRVVQGQTFWVGSPLVVHRRCIEPMFSISNHVAYNDAMFLHTTPPEEEEVFALERSQWFHIKGSEVGKKDHSVYKQTEFVLQFMKYALTLYKNLPDIYIISPFKSVITAIRKRLVYALKEEFPDIRFWVNRNCGTVHTFQGKEAKEVLLVLGCDQYNGKSAASWVGKSPNIINVAVSRAKYRLGVVGDHELWSNISFVKELARGLGEPSIDHIFPSDEIPPLDI